jgi:perosamine synthetase
MIVHTFGNAVYLDELVSICKKRNISIIEDCAESLGTKYIKGKFNNMHTGTIGRISCFSFNGNKIITSAGGGMILTNDTMKAKKARYLINQAKDNSFKFIHNQIGYNYRLSNIHAAIGFAQFQKLRVFLKRKNNIQKLYLKYLKEIEGIKLINTSNYSKNNYWLNIICIDKKKFNKNSSYLLKKLNNKNIKARPIWFPNHLQKKFKKYQSFKINNANKIYSNCICLPSSINLTDQDIYKICNMIHE